MASVIKTNRKYEDIAEMIEKDRQAGGKKVSAQWNSGGKKPELPTQSEPSEKTETLPQDRSGLIKKLSDAALRKKMAGLAAARDESLARLKSEQAAAEPNYAAAAAAAAAESDLQRRNFNEFAAASGLNSGAAAAEKLSRDNLLYARLGDIELARAGAKSDAERRRSDILSQYASDIAAARAEGEYTLAEKLYEEAVRLDEAMVEASRYADKKETENREFDYKVARDEQLDRLKLQQQAIKDPETTAAQQALRQVLAEGIGNLSDLISKAPQIIGQFGQKAFEEIVKFFS